jgi:hypothetical protein
VQLLRALDGQSQRQDGEPLRDKVDAILRADDADVDDPGASLRDQGAIKEESVLRVL